MEAFLFMLFGGLMIFQSGLCQQDCHNGKVWNDCGSPCTQTCENYETLFCIEMCEAKCECPSGAPIWHNGECIPAAECPQDCNGGQVWNDCGSPCTTTCDNYNETLVCAAVCEPKCECPSGAPIWHNGGCVTAQDCSDHGEEDCRDGKEWNTCGSPCTKTCENHETLSCIERCDAKCECPSNAPIWHNGGCVAADECPQECPDIQEWKTCASPCVKTCDNYDALVCIESCRDGCECPVGKPIWHDGQCISEFECVDDTGAADRIIWSYSIFIAGITIFYNWKI